MDTQQFQASYAAGKRDFPWVDLTGAELQGLQLADASFNRARLRGADLQQADLQRANFFRADLTGANLSGANLADCNFRKANLTGAIADLSGLPATALQGATLPDGAIAPRVDISPPSPETPSPATASPETSPPETSPPLPIAAAAPPSPSPPASPPPKPASAPQLPRTPLSLWAGGYFLAGLTLYLSAGHAVAWAVTALSAILWCKEALTLFIPIVVGLAVLLGSPITLPIGVIVSAVLTLMTFGGLWVSGWSFRQALYGALWLGGIAAVILIWGSWLLLRPSPMGITLSPLLPLAIMVVLTLGGVTVGLTSIGALIDHGWRRSQQVRILVGLAWGNLAIALVIGLGLETWLLGTTHISP